MGVRASFGLTFLTLVCLVSCRAMADVAVLTNRANGPVRFSVTGPDNRAEDYRLEPGDTLPLAAPAPLRIDFQADGQRRQYALVPDAIYFFAGRQPGLTFAQLMLPDAPASDGQTPAGPEEGRKDALRSSLADPIPPAREAARRPVAIGVVPVKILVDEDEPAVERIWEQRLRERVAKASAVFERWFRIRFEVTATGTWDSDDAVNDFHRSLAEFEAEVSPAPATLAIGFTSQYPMDRASPHLGGTRGPLYPYILIREWSPQIAETERLEILVHELGHFLGAVHSADDNSAMRPMMTDRRARARSFQITFDPLNTLAMGLVSEELRRGAGSFVEFRAATRARLRSIYAAQAKALPDDPATARYVGALERLEGILQPREESSPLVAGVRTVLEAVVAAAKENDLARRRQAAGMPSDVVPLDGDRLTEHLVRRAAAAAKDLPAEVAPQAFLLGLGIGLDDSGLLRGNPVVGSLIKQAETDERREERLAALGSPTMRGRRDLAQHFAISAALAVLLSPQAAEAIGIFKEIRDAQGGTGFSFADLAADLAGLTFAGEVRRGRLSLETLATGFTVAGFLPPVDDLSEGLPWKTFVDTYGSANDDRFARELTAIRARISSLPGYEKSQ